LYFLNKVSRGFEISNFMKNPFTGFVKCGRAGGRKDGPTGMTKIKDAFRNFVKALKNQQEEF